MNRRAKCAAFALALAALGASAAAETPIEARYLALKSDHVDGRRGPGGEHRIEWVYRRAGLPVRVLAESGPWRRVEDPGGAMVWMHATDLEERRTVYVRGDRVGTAAMRQEPRSDGRTQAFLERGVVAALEACRGEWRRIQVDGRTGWVEAASLWGAERC